MYGPHLNETPAGGWGTAAEADKLVKTHCCFCGVQCGIQLKVKDNLVVGVQPVALVGGGLETRDGLDRRGRGHGHSRLRTV